MTEEEKREKGERGENEMEEKLWFWKAIDTAIKYSYVRYDEAKTNEERRGIKDKIIELEEAEKEAKKEIEAILG